MTAHEAAVQAYPSHDAITKMDKKTIQMFRDIFIKGWQARDSEIKELRDYLSTIAGWAGNLPDEHYTSRAGPNDAALRGSMVVAMRTLAKKALE